MHFTIYAKKVVAYRIEILLSMCIAVTLVVIVLVTISIKNDKQDLPSPEPDVAHISKLNIDEKNAALIFVEISGAVYKPGVYALSEGSRLAGLIEKAEGLNKHADKGFFYRNYNQARVLLDGEKVHAPSFEEIAKGSFVEQPLIIYTNKISVVNDQSTTSSTGLGEGGDLVSIGSATVAELEGLPGVGKVTAEKIIDARPYNAIDELRAKGVISESLFTKIRPLISL